MGWQQVVQHALPYGILLSVLLTAIIGCSFAVAPDMWAGDYPPDIRAKFGDKSARARRWQPIVAVAFFLTVLVVVADCLYRFSQDVAGEANLLEFYVSALTVMMVFNLFDLIILDWLVFNLWQPRWIILPGTEGLAGYRDYGFHLLAFLKGSIAIALVSAPISLIAWWLQWAIKVNQ